MRISEVASEAEVNVQTVRLYERRGLLKAPRRTTAGYRDYPQATVELIRFIKDAQGLGFTLREIKQLIALRDPEQFNAAEAGELARAKMREIEDKIARLVRMRERLVHDLTSCNCNGVAEDCLLVNPKPRT
jgi:DNA-binding transcriptional MerR regulator